jgi:hypothetical protein
MNTSMKTSILLFTACAFWFLSSAQRLYTQSETPSDVTAVIQFSDGQTATVTSSSDTVGLQPNETVNITVQFSQDKAGHLLKVEPLDGGCVLSGSQTVVASDGTAIFQFQGGRSPGRYQLSVHDSAEEVGLQFWVLDLTNPQNNPRVLAPGNPAL